MNRVFHRALPLLLLGLFLTGCHSRLVGLRLDWDGPMRVHLLAADGEIVPEAPEQRRLAKLLENAIPRMVAVPGDPLEAPYRLRLIGQSPEGIRLERVYHLGPNWLGSGGRLVVLSEREARSMRQLISFILENNNSA